MYNEESQRVRRSIIYFEILGRRARRRFSHGLDVSPFRNSTVLHRTALSFPSLYCFFPPTLSLPFFVVSPTMFPAAVTPHISHHSLPTILTKDSPFVVSPSPCVTPVTASPSPLPAPETTLPVVFVIPDTPWPTVLPAAPSVFPEWSRVLDCVGVCWGFKGRW
jgi:hypothetical protein